MLTFGTLVEVNWLLLIALLAAIAVWPIIQLRTGMIDGRFRPRVWMMVPVVSIAGVLVALVVGSAE